SFLVAQWDVIARSHRWLFGLLILIAYLSWAGSLVIWAVDIDKFYHDTVVRLYFPEWPYEPKEDFKPLGYSQLLAAAVSVKPLWAVTRLTFTKRRSILEWIKNCPVEVWRSILFVFTGQYNPRRKIMERQRTTSSESFKQLILPEGLNSPVTPMSRTSLYKAPSDDVEDEDEKKGLALSPTSAMMAYGELLHLAV
ncbi:hypothetical protein Moror_10916, partial [Moniliophthora roreri MCA 2997]